MAMEPPRRWKYKFGYYPRLNRFILVDKITQSHFTQSYDVFIDLLLEFLGAEVNLEVIAEREEHGVMMCMKGRKKLFRVV